MIWQWGCVLRGCSLVQRWLQGVALHPAPLHPSHAYLSMEGHGSSSNLAEQPSSALCPGVSPPEDCFRKGSKHAWCGLHLPMLLHRGEDLEKSAWK